MKKIMELEGEFIESWESIKQFYDGWNEKYLPKNQIINFIQKLIDKGFNKTIRAGQSLTTLMLSRAKIHGLNENQSFLTFRFPQKKLIIENKKGVVYESDKIELNDEIINIIKELEKKEID